MTTTQTSSHATQRHIPETERLLALLRREFTMQAEPIKSISLSQVYQTWIADVVAAQPGAALRLSETGFAEALGVKMVSIHEQDGRLYLIWKSK